MDKVFQLRVFRPDRSLKNRPTCPISAQTEAPVSRRQVSDSKNQQQQVKWWVASPKPEQPEPN